MIEIITAWGAAKIATYVGGSVAAFLVAWFLKRMPNEQIYTFVEEKAHTLGKWMTLTASKKSKLWNATIESWVIDLLNNTVMAFMNGLIRGLKSDNPNQQS